MGFQYVLVVICKFSGWIKAFLCKKADAMTVTKKLFKNVFSLWDIPKEISGETHFTGQIIRQLNKVLGTQCHYNYTYHPRSSQRAERANGI